jgi:hypothetical protein
VFGSEEPLTVFRFPTVFADNPFTIWDYFPPTFSCPWEMQRIGRLGDGGKWYVQASNTPLKVTTTDGEK